MKLAVRPNICVCKKKYKPRGGGILKRLGSGGAPSIFKPKSVFVQLFNSSPQYIRGNDIKKERT